MSSWSKILLAVTVTAGFVSGCATSERPPLFWRFRSQNAGDCCTNGSTVAGDGPILDSAPNTLPPARPIIGTPQSTQNCGPAPAPAPVPRLVPQPTSPSSSPSQSQPRPYVPQ